MFARVKESFDEIRRFGEAPLEKVISEVKNNLETHVELLLKSRPGRNELILMAIVVDLMESRSRDDYVPSPVNFETLFGESDRLADEERAKRDDPRQEILAKAIARHESKHKPVVTSQTKPVVTEPKPVVAEPKSVVTEPKPVVAEPKSVIAEPKPEPKPVVAEPKSEPKPVVTSQTAQAEPKPKAPFKLKTIGRKPIKETTPVPAPVPVQTTVPLDEEELS